VIDVAGGADDVRHISILDFRSFGFAQDRFWIFDFRSVNHETQFRLG
jgi:hypothetical protein